MQTLEQLYSGSLAGSSRLKMSCGLKEFPKEIYSLADSLEILDLSGNELSSLPEDFGRLYKLRILFLSDNQFTVFPEVLSQCKALDIIGFKANKIATFSETALPHNTRWLILTNNRLEKLPRSIGQCIRMQKLMLAGNCLTNLPEELSQCRNLGLLRLSANRIEALPEWLWKTPKLSWLAFSGNPCHTHPAASNTLLVVPWQELELTALLGEGASGVISKAIWKNENHSRDRVVAVKVFKGEVTSDGMPADEMDACTAAGSHPHIVKVLGKISGHPDKKQGLVLELIPPTYRNLGGPPSFVSCTRDTFAEGTAFSLEKIIHIAAGIASAAAHLHQRGIMHGDLYAHNILTDEHHHPLFGDFGAATTYNPEDGQLAPVLERLEVCAFGCLLDDLLQHADDAAMATTAFKILSGLRDECMNPEVMKRPLFKQLVQELTAVKALG